MTEWQEVSLSQLGAVVTGSTPPRAAPESFGDHTDFITPSDLDFATRQVFAGRQLSELGVDAMRRRLLPPGSVCFTCIGATIGKMCLTARPAVTNQQINSIIPNDSTSATFLYYLLRHERERIAGLAGGAATPLINKSSFSRITVRVPGVLAQNAIGDTLGVVDDLIENNRRRVEVLEEMARAIYREWFVHLRFPGHEDATFVDSDLGPIPEGWSVEPLGSVATVEKGLSYKGAFLTEHGVPMANLKCIAPDGGFRRGGDKPYSGTYKERHEVHPGDILIANTDLTQAGHVIGAPARVPERGFAGGGIMSHHLSAIRPDIVGKGWVYRALQDRRFREYARSVASGATVLGFRPDDMKSYPVILPSETIRRHFEESEESIAALQERLNDTADELVQLRDMLLPKLVTGQIDVSELDLDAVIARRERV
jgi:type I restriction enzyme S subunit